jgi:type II secretory pathway pseudopilin PulG
MKDRSFIKAQRGATLVVSLIMLALITLLVTSAFSLSTSSLRSVGNMQNRDEAIAAANKAIEQVLSSPFTNAPTGESIDVDINNDDTRDYEVVFETPTCVSAEQIAAATIPPSSLSLGGFFNSVASDYYETVWDLDANVTHLASGTSVHVRQGVRVLLSQVQFDAVCS